MAANKKMTVKVLTEEFYKLKDDLSEYNMLKKKVFELENANETLKKQLKVIEEKVETLQRKTMNSNSENDNSEETAVERLKCRKCEKLFPSMKKLRTHLGSNHPSKIECSNCDKTFSRNYDLEVHIKTDHEERDMHKCDKCDKIFLLKWRLLKHKQNHDNTLTKKCHYFNNNLTCPFEEMGCMFAHEASAICKFDRSCANDLCSFRHSKVPEEPIEENGDTDNESEENDMEVEPCESCGQIFDEIEDLIDHYGTTGHMK